MLAFFQTDLTWRELAKRTIKETSDDDGMGLAAQLAYYFFLALFPALLFLLALASFFPIRRFTEQLPQMLGSFAAPQMVDLLRQQIEQISNQNDGGLLSLGLLGAIWSSSAAMVAIIGALNRAYDIEEARPWWKVRLTAILLTLGTAIFILVSFTLVLAGPELVDAVASRAGLGTAFEWAWKILQWPVALALVVIGIELIYYYAPDAEQEWVWVTPGAVIATVLWLVASLAFRFYVVNFGNYEETYGALGAIILLMLWFYMTGLAIVIGAEANAEIEHASPWGKAPGEKVAGQRKKIGAAAYRAYQETLERWKTTPVPVERQLPAVTPREPRTKGGMFVRLAVLVMGLIGLRRNSPGDVSNRAPSE
jgi:membrane protein